VCGSNIMIVLVVMELFEFGVLAILRQPDES
jgi:hypothetical protein